MEALDGASGERGSASQLDAGEKLDQDDSGDQFEAGNDSSADRYVAQTPCLTTKNSPNHHTSDAQENKDKAMDSDRAAARTASDAKNHKPENSDAQRCGEILQRKSGTLESKANNSCCYNNGGASQDCACRPPGQDSSVAATQRRFEKSEYLRFFADSLAAHPHAACRSNSLVELSIASQAKIRESLHGADCAADAPPKRRSLTPKQEGCLLHTACDDDDSRYLQDDHEAEFPTYQQLHQYLHTSSFYGNKGRAHDIDRSAASRSETRGLLATDNPVPDNDQDDDDDGNGDEKDNGYFVKGGGDHYIHVCMHDDDDHDDDVNDADDGVTC
jgi:hypothetical protein